MKSGQHLFFVLRTIVIICMIMALSGFHFLYPAKGMSSVIVVDRSKSVEDAKTLQLISAITEQMEQTDEIGIIGAGLSSEIELPLTTKANNFYNFETNINANYTNIEESLRIASSMLSNKKQKKMILISDGNENIGNMQKKAEELKRRGIPVDVIPISNNQKEDIVLSSFVAPNKMFIGEKGNLSLKIDSTIQTEALLQIYKNNQLIINQKVALQAGGNTFQFPTIGTTTGFHTFRAEVLANQDEVSENNEHYSFTYVEGTPKVLIVEGENGDAENLIKALASSQIDFQRINPKLLPTTLSSYLSYQSIIFTNVSATDVSENQMELIQAAVRQFGVGFIMTGGGNSYGLGGYFKTPIEEILPVYMDLKGKKEIPSLGLALVIDKSGSMMGQKISLAKEAAARSTELLREKDTINVIAFDSTMWEIVPPTLVKEKEKIIDDIRSIPADGGTDIFPSLQQAYENLKNVDAKRKHIILLTDGQSATQMAYENFIEDGKEKGITLSTVALGMDSDKFLLEGLAALGGGRYYDVQDDSTIPTIFSREAVMMTRTYIEDDPFYPKLSYGFEWQNLLENGMPQMNAYIGTTPKQRAQVILASNKNDPILARWNYGLGKTVAYTSDLTGKWAGEWPSWNNWAPLWNDILSWTFPAYEGIPYHLSQSIQGNQITVAVNKEDPLFQNTKVSIVSEKGKEIESNFRTIAPGAGEVVFHADEPGIYYLQISEGENQAYRFKTGIVIPYSNEFDKLPINEKGLKALAEGTHGKWITNIDDFVLHDVEQQYERQDVHHVLLLLALFLLMLDIAVRRFRLSIPSKFGWRLNRNKPKLTDVKKTSEKPEEKTEDDQQKEVKTMKKVNERKTIENNETPNDRMNRLLKAKSRRKR